MMKTVLNKIKHSYKLHDDDGAFDLLSGVIILKKSVVDVFSNNWIKKQNADGTWCNSNKDGKIDLIDISVNHSNRVINVSCVQVQNSTFMKNDKIQLFVKSVADYFINEKKIEDETYLDLISKQEEFQKKKIENSNYSLTFNFFLSYVGNSNLSSKLEQCVNELNLPNVSFEVFDKDKLDVGLDKIKSKSNNPSDVECNIHSSNLIIEENNNKFYSFTLLLDSEQIKKIIKVEQENNIELNRLFNNNVRGFLENTSINNQIKDTIVKYSDSFYYCNNGATIFCDEIVKLSNHQIHVINPRIINGQQSIASMYLYDYDNKASILSKFVSVKDNQNQAEMMNLLCMTTNTSNQIKPINLISNSKLIIETKQLFADNGIGLNIKEGSLLNNIFVDNSDIELEELLKLWATFYMNRPDFAKAKGKVVNIFYKAELDDKKYMILKNNLVIDIIKTELYDSYKFSVTVKDVISELQKKDYYSHGYYVILYMIYIQYGIQPDISKIDIKTISSKIESFISKYKKEMEANSKSYSLNNYFKSSRPLKDLNVQLVSELSYIENITNKIKK